MNNNFLSILKQQQQKQLKTSFVVSSAEQAENIKVMDVNGNLIPNPFTSIRNMAVLKNGKLNVKDYLNPEYNMAAVILNSPKMEDGKVVKATFVDSLNIKLVDRTEVEQSLIPVCYKKNTTIPKFSTPETKYDEKGNEYMEYVGIFAYDAKTGIVKKQLTDKEIVVSEKESKTEGVLLFEKVTIDDIEYTVSAALVKTNQIVYLSTFKDGFNVEEYITKEKYSIVAPYRAQLFGVKQGDNKRVAIVFLASLDKAKVAAFKDAPQCAAKGNGITVSVAKSVELFEKYDMISKGSYDKKVTVDFKVQGLASKDTLIFVNNEYLTIEEFAKKLGFMPVILVIEKRKKRTIKKVESGIELSIEVDENGNEITQLQGEDYDDDDMNNEQVSSNEEIEELDDFSDLN